MAANPLAGRDPEHAPPPRGPLGCLAGFGLLGGVLTLALGTSMMVFNAAPIVFIVPTMLVAVFFVVQLVFTRVLRLPVQGPSEPMGPPPDVESGPPA